MSLCLRVRARAHARSDPSLGRRVTQTSRRQTQLYYIICTSPRGHDKVTRAKGGTVEMLDREVKNHRAANKGGGGAFDMV